MCVGGWFSNKVQNNKCDAQHQKPQQNKENDAWNAGIVPKLLQF